MKTETRINDGGDAFPSATCGDWRGGMSLRDAFALAAMQGMLSDQREGSYHSNLSVQGMADVAYQHADAMIYAREKQPAEEG